MNDKSEPQVAPGDNPDSSGCHASTKRDDAHAGHAAKQALPSQRPSSDSSESSSRALIEESATFAHFALTTAQAAADHLSDYELVQEISRADSLQASWTAHRLALIARLHQRPVMLPPPTPEANSAVRQPRKGLSRDDLTATEIAPALHISEDAARRLLNRALTLTQRLPNTLDLYSGGLLNESRAHAVADLVGKMADWAYAAVLEEDGSPRLAEHAATALAGMVEKRVLKRAPGQRTDQLRDSLRRAIARVAPAYAESITQNSVSGRDVFVSQLGQDEQMGFLGAHLPIIEAKACYSALSVRAQALRDLGDLRTLDQLRADFLVQAILNPRQGLNLKDSVEPTGPDLNRGSRAESTDPHRSTDASHTTTGTGTSSSTTPDFDWQCHPALLLPKQSPPRGTGADPEPSPTVEPDQDTEATSWQPRNVARGVKAHVQVTVSIETLLGLNDDAGHLTGYGAITAQTLRDLAFQSDSTWRRLIVDAPSGTLLDYGRTKYRPPAALTDHVIARHVTCTHPGCTRAAENCDLDHLLPFPLGATCECNLHPLCRRHHRIKHETGWDTFVSDDISDPEGTLVSTSPTGHTYKTLRPSLAEASRAHQQTQPGNSSPEGQGLRESSSQGTSSATKPTEEESGEPPF